MAFLRQHRIKGLIYIYIIQSVRKGKKVTGKILEYLGRADELDPKRLKRAMEYWGVKALPKKRKKAKR